MDDKRRYRSDAELAEEIRQYVMEHKPLTLSEVSKALKSGNDRVARLGQQWSIPLPPKLKPGDPSPRRDKVRTAWGEKFHLPGTPPSMKERKAA